MSWRASRGCRAIQQYIWWDTCCISKITRFSCLLSYRTFMFHVATFKTSCLLAMTDSRPMKQAVFSSAASSSLSPPTPLPEWSKWSRPAIKNAWHVPHV